ncbi:MAG TPA: VanW family protein [Gaiellaceae bacterium]|nr:VanW family protein [Gaiellaceae bacterium]
MSVRVANVPRDRRRRRARVRLLWQWSLLVAIVVLIAAIALGLAFAGSPERLPAGSQIAGVDVSGLTPGQARSLLEKRSNELASVPVVFTAAGRHWSVKPKKVVVDVDWGAAVEAAQRQGEGFGPFRGLKRLGVRVFGGEVVPTSSVYQSAVDAYMGKFAREVDRASIEPSLVLQGSGPEILGGRNGRLLDRAAAEKVFVQGLTALQRKPVAVPLKVDRTHLTTRDLAGAKVKAEAALSGPVDVAYGHGGWHLSVAKISRILELPSNGDTELRLAGPRADRFFANLKKRIEHAPKDATFAIGARNIVRVVPAQPGRTLNMDDTTRNLMAALLSPTSRKADLAVTTASPERTTADARAMGITGLVGAYETFYGGVPNRIHNVQLVAHLIDNRFISPNEEFSFNATTGERSEAKGFLEAPVIINGELQTGLGGGVCQVSTTTFNAAYEAGLPITDRTNHALYISHYPQGRDATVNYPDTDLKFVNDTGHWLLLRTFVSSSSLTVALYGTPQHREVESEVSPLVVNGQPPVKRVPDPNLTVGTSVLEESGEPSRSTSVRRKVFSSSGKLLYDHTWYSSYSAEPRVIRYGTKPKAEPPPPPPPPEKKQNPPPPPPPPPHSPPPLGPNG